MLIQEEKNRQEQLHKYLWEMSETTMDDKQLRQIIIGLKSLYANNFRHSYSQFLPMIIEIAADSNRSIDYLAENLNLARELVEKDYVDGEKEFKGLYQPLTKLSDHINLEIGRYNQYNLSELKVKDMEERNSTLRDELRKATDDLNDAKNKLASVQTELIAVLSIFAAIVLAFSGSFGFIGNSLSGMSTAPFFKSVFFVVLCGFIVFNLIFLLMYIVGKITGRNIYARCKTENCTCKKQCSGINRVRKRLPYIFWMNVAFFILLLLDVTLWFTSCYLG